MTYDLMIGEMSKMKKAKWKVDSTFQFSDVTEKEVLKIIFILKKSSAIGVDYILTRTIKGASDLVAAALSHIIYPSVTSSYTASKVAQLLPKCGTSSQVI